MPIQLRPWQYSALLVLVCAALVGGLLWYRTREISLAGQIRHMPFREGVLLHMDVRALRSSGVLELIAGSPRVEELEYRQFVANTGFNYREDLDSILASFARNEVYALLRGRFNWRQLQQYARDHGGQCLNAYCSLEGSQHGRIVSFFPLESDLLAIAVSQFPGAAYALAEERKDRPLPALPAQPLWALLHEDVLRDTRKLPDGTRAFVSSMQGARFVTLALGAGDHGFEAELRMEFPAEDAAGASLKQLETMTDFLRKFLARAGQSPSEDDLSGVLTNGRFERLDRQVVGRWPISWAFLRSVSEAKF